MKSRVCIGEIADINKHQYKKTDLWQCIEYIDTGSVDSGVVNNLQTLVPGVDIIPSRAKRKVKNQSIIYSTVRPNQNHFAILEEPQKNTLVSTGFAVIDCNKDKVVPRFLYYALTRPDVTKYFQGLAEQSVSTYPTLNPSDIASFSLNIPDYETQQKIVGIAESIDRKIDTNHQINDYLAALSKAILQQHVYTELPYGITTVQDFTVAMSNGTTPKRGNESFWADGTIPWVKTGEVNNNLIFKTAEHITDLALEKTSLRILPKDAVVMALYGSGTAGRLALLQVPATTNQACTSMVCESAAESFYLFVTLQGMYREIDNLTRGSVQQNLSKDIVASLKIPNVTEEFLEKFGLSTIYAAIAANSKAILLLEEYRDALLPRLMSGEIDVSQVDLTPQNNHLPEQ